MNYSMKEKQKVKSLSRQPIDVPCNDQGGLKLSGNFSVVSGFFTSLTFDFSQPFVLHNQHEGEEDHENHCYRLEDSQNDDDNNGHHNEQGNNDSDNYSQLFGNFLSLSDHDNGQNSGQNDSPDNNPEENDNDDNNDTNGESYEDDNYRLKQSIPILDVQASPPFVPGILIVKLKEAVTILTDSNNLSRLTGIASLDALADKRLCFQIIPLTDYIKDMPNFDPAVAHQVGADKLYIFFFYPTTDVVLAMFDYETDSNVESVYMDSIIEIPRVPRSTWSILPVTESIPTIVQRAPKSIWNPNDPLALRPYPDGELDYLNAIHASGGWGYATGSQDLKIAVIDTGIDDTHPEFDGRIIQSTAYYTGKCYHDVCTGSGCNTNCSSQPYACPKTDSASKPIPYLAGKAYTDTDHLHGTHVAGIIGARGDNRMGIAGINWSSKIISHRVFQWDKDTDPDNSYTTCGDKHRACATSSNIIAALNSAVWEGVKVMNLSLGGYANDNCVSNASGMHCDTVFQNYQDVVNFAETFNIVVVAAAGNDGQKSCPAPNVDHVCDNGTANDVYYPASFDTVISVASMAYGSGSPHYALNTSGFSNFGKVDIAAPGEVIWSTIPLDLRATYLPSKYADDYTDSNGTSMAAPFVSGLASLVFTINPDLTAAQVRSYIYDYATDIPAGGGNPKCSTTSGIDDCTGHGLIDMQNTLSHVPEPGAASSPGNANPGNGGSAGGCTAAFISFWPGIYHQFGLLGLFLMVTIIRTFGHKNRQD